MLAFDGAALAVTVFVPEGAGPSNRVPFVLMTHGWAGERVTEPTGRVAQFLDAGYGVLTWDSRGFGASGGEVMLNSPDHEVRDVTALINFLSNRVGAVKKVGGDPVIGMAGGSYAGGIQLLAAAFEPRIDAIAPEITWNDLVTALAPNDVPKLYWTSLLFGAGLEASCVNARNEDPAGAITAATFPLTRATTGCQTSDLAFYYSQVHATGGVPDEVRDALRLRSPATYMDAIDVPTLLIQGFPDTLFDVNQAVANYEGIKANGAPVKLWLYDGGHGHPEGPALPNTQAALIGPTVINWFDRHLKGDTGVDTGPEVQYYAGGAWHNATSWPDPAATTTTVHQAGVPSLMQGVVTGGPPSSFSLPLLSGPATLAGPASISFEGTGTGSEGIVFASLAIVDAAGTSVVANAQTQPLRFAFGQGEWVSVASDLVAVEGAIPAGGRLVLTLTTMNRDYDNNRVPGLVNLEDLDVTVNTI